MKKTVLFSVLALTATAFADGDYVASQMKPGSQQMSQQTTPKPARSVVTLTSARPESDYGWYAFADVLYWHADTGQADWAFKNTNIASTTGIKGTNYALNYKWNWGFRVGLGMNMNHDQWDSNIMYTWFQTHGNSGVSTKSTESANDTKGLVGTFLTGHNHGRVHFSMIDWDLGRWFYVSKKLSLRPHGGVKGGWITQNLNKSFTVSTTEKWKVTSENEFWGIGVSGGVNTSWLFYKMDANHFSCFADFAGALMYGHFENEHKEIQRISEDVGPLSLRVKGLNRNRVAPMLQSILGFGYDIGLYNDSYHLGVKLGYEFQYWFNQNQMLIDERPVGAFGLSYSRAAEDLAFQGLTLDVRFDF